VVPTSKLADEIINNLDRRQRYFQTKHCLVHDTPPAMLDAFKRRVHDLAESSIDLELHCCFDVATWPEERQARRELILAIIRLAEATGVEFASPTQTAHVPSEDIKRVQALEGEEEARILRFGA